MTPAAVCRRQERAEARTAAAACGVVRNHHVASKRYGRYLPSMFRPECLLIQRPPACSPVERRRAAGNSGPHKAISVLRECRETR